MMNDEPVWSGGQEAYIFRPCDEERVQEVLR